MGRYHEWTSSYSGVIKYLEKNSFVIDVRGVKGKTDMYYGVEIKKIVFKYAKDNKLKGSFSDILIYISNNFKSFAVWVKQTDYLLKYKTQP